VNDLHPAGPIIGGLVSLLCLWFSLRQRRRHRLLHDLPTSKVHGVFIGLVELEGAAESEAPLTSHLAERACVHYTWSAEEHWRRTRTEHYTDSKGNRRTRTVTSTGWETVASGGEMQDFYLRDDTGARLVRSEGATIEPLPLFSETVSRGHPLYHGKAPEAWVNGSTGERRFTERGIPLHARLYVLGSARERADLVAPEIAAARDSEFILSCRGEDAIKRGFALGSWATWFLGLLALPAGFVFAQGSHPPPGPETAPIPGVVAPCLIAAFGWLALWGLGWVWMVHDSLIGLRERVRQAWSLIDVQLKRRHDLLPMIAKTVEALASHEQSAQTALAALRSQFSATRPGVAGPDPAALAPALRVVVERYPVLTADTGFAALHREMVETEQRIALARTYYNDIATHYATRLELVPDRFVARLRDLRPEPLLAAADFERAPVNVTFAA
jgi:hypothetical protein